MVLMIFSRDRADEFLHKSTCFGHQSTCLARFWMLNFYNIIFYLVSDRKGFSRETALKSPFFKGGWGI